jgi:lipoate-protein ligase A
MWRLLYSAAATGAENMALDEALMTRARESGEWILRVYSWSRPTVSFGRNQTALGGYDMARLAASNVDVVRRPTGGRAILHHREITYSVTAPVENAGDLRESYGRINRLLLAALRALGVDAAVAGSVEARRTGGNPVPEQPGLLPCFHHPSPGEIMAGGRKLAGSAQWRCNGALLQHGSILVDDDQMQLASFLIEAGPPVPRPATLRAALGRAPNEQELAHALFEAVRHHEDPGAVELFTDSILEKHTRALCCRYLDPAWTWRR